MLYFEGAAYYNLTFVRTKNDLGQWIRFFLTGVTDIEKNRIMGMGKRSRNAMRLLTHLFKNPAINAKEVQSVTNLSPKAANDLVQLSIENKILKEITGYRRNRIFVLEEYIQLF